MITFEDLIVLFHIQLPQLHAAHFVLSPPFSTAVSCALRYTALFITLEIYYCNQMPH